MENKILKWALDKITGDGKYIDKVSNGLECNCICELCGERLVAVQGKEREWHFRHYVDTNCIGSQETALHRFAREIISRNRRISIPGKVITYSEVIQGRKFKSILPDLILISEGCKIYVEIAVTHFNTSSKNELYVSNECDSIEIDLSHLPYDISPEDLEDLVLNNTEMKRIIYWKQSPLAERVYSTNSFSWGELIGSILFCLVMIFFVHRGIKWIARRL